MVIKFTPERVTFSCSICNDDYVLVASMDQRTVSIAIQLDYPVKYGNTFYCRTHAVGDLKEIPLEEYLDTFNPFEIKALIDQKKKELNG